MKTIILICYIIIYFTKLIYSQPPPPGGNSTQSGGMSFLPPPSGGGNSAECDTKTKSITVETNINDQSKFPGGYVKITTDGCPGYDWTSQTTPNKARKINKQVYLPIEPKLAKNPIYVGIKNKDGSKNTNPSKGPIGIAINGVSIYGNADAMNEDAFINEGKTFDQCGGHPQEMGEYHYHEEPPQGCVFKDTAGQHSPLFGFMYDGIPIFGQLGDDGKYPTDFDECGGHVDKTYPFYHYHLPKGGAFPYVVSCLKGCIYDANSNMFMMVNGYVKTMNTCELDSKQYNYSETYKRIKFENNNVAISATYNDKTISGNFIKFYFLGTLAFMLLL